MKAVRQRTHIISVMTHKVKLPCVDQVDPLIAYRGCHVIIVM